MTDNPIREHLHAHVYTANELSWSLWDAPLGQQAETVPLCLIDVPQVRVKGHSPGTGTKRVHLT